MKTTIQTLMRIFFLCIISSGCEDETPVFQNISGKLSSHSECKTKKSAPIIADLADTLTCVDYSFVAKDSIIYLNHKNAGFNCCPGELSCFIYLSGDTIIIHELEEAPQCDCDCLFDLEIEIYGATSKNYTLKFVEPYSGDQKSLVFDIDLTKSKTGSFCATRRNYPWGMSSLDYLKK